MAMIAFLCSPCVDILLTDKIPPLLFEVPSDGLFEWAEPSEQLVDNACHLVGFGFDGTACFRKGTRLGPDAIRAISDGIESYSPYLNADLEDAPFYDLGNLSLDPVVNYEDESFTEQQWHNATAEFEGALAGVDMAARGIRMVTLGGEHSISYGPIKRYLQQYPDLVLIHLDAHADLRDGYLGYQYSHASVIRRCLDHFGLGHQLIQYGIRSGTREEYQWMRKHRTLCRSRDEFLQRVAEIADHRPVYLTLDLDYFDPCYLPGTGTPEPGGEDFHSFVSLVKRLQSKHFVGCDVVELSPPIDATGNSDVFAAKVVRELLLALR